MMCVLACLFVCDAGVRQMMHNLDSETNSAKEGSFWLPWREYQQLAAECELKDAQQLSIATSFLHDNGVLRYFGDVGTAWYAQESCCGP